MTALVIAFFGAAIWVVLSAIDTSLGRIAKELEKVVAAKLKEGR